MTENSRGIGGGATRRKKRATAKAEKMPRKTVPIYYEKGDSEDTVARKYAALATSPELAAYRVISGAERVSGVGEHLDVPALLEQLRDQAAVVNRGDLAHTEAMLMNQATALQTLFARLAERAMSCDHIPGFEAMMRAIAFSEYLESHARRIYSYATRPDIDAAKTLLKRLAGGKLTTPFKTRDVYIKGWTGLETPQKAQAAIDLLREYNHLTEYELDTGGRPTRMYQSRVAL